MLKVSEVIKLAIPAHAAAKELSLQGRGICFVLNDLLSAGKITFEEMWTTKEFINDKVLCGQHGWLKGKLQAQKKASNQAARVAYYERLVTKLEKQGL